jgi:hypothetical protein
MAMLAAMSSLFTSPFGAKPSHTSHTTLSALSQASYEYIHPDAKTESTWFDVSSDEESPKKTISFWANLPCCGSTRTKGRRSSTVSKSGAPVAPREALLVGRPGHVRSDSMRELLAHGAHALDQGVFPTPLSEGLCGSYLISSVDKVPLGVFKPGDEEVGCDHNQKGHSPRNLVSAARPSIEAGNGMYREVAASLLDHGNFAGVPQTSLVTCLSPFFGSEKKLGSFQEFVPSKCVAGDMGCSLFPVADIQRIALLDMRLVNLDRHDGNILVRYDEHGQVRLVPIDHGLCLPSRLEVAEFEWCWLSWPQTKLAIEEDVFAYIKTLDAERDITLLQQTGIPLSPAAANVLRVTTEFIKLAASAGLSMFEIAAAMVRMDAETPSPLETAVLEIGGGDIKVGLQSFVARLV